MKSPASPSTASEQIFHAPVSFQTTPTRIANAAPIINAGDAMALHIANATTFVVIIAALSNANAATRAFTAMTGARITVFRTVNAVERTPTAIVYAQ